MRGISFVLFASLALFAAPALAEDAVNELEADHGDVIVLKPEDFAEGGKVYSGNWLIKYYAPSCGFCKMLAPTWKSLATETQEDDLPLNVAMFNVREDRDISQKYNIGKLPGIKLLRDGQVYTFPDARSGKTNDEYIEYGLETYQEIEDAENARVAEEKRKFEEMEANSDVVKLTLENFEEITAEGNWMIEFFGPKCGYCKKLEPTWELLGTKVNTDESMGFKVAKFDAAAGFKYTSAFKANPWPAIKFISNEKAYTFPEPRNFDKTLEEYIAFAQGGWETEGGDAIELPYIEAAKKRAARRAKYSKKKAHTEL